MPSLPDLSAFVIGGGLAALLSAAYPIIQTLRGWWADRARIRVPEIMDLSGDIVAAMRTCLEEVGANRVAVVVVHNGGGILHPGTQIYSSIVYEVVAHGVPQVRDRWQQILVDEHYRSLVAQVIREDHVILRTSTLDPDAVVRPAYEYADCVLSDTRIVGVTPKRVHLAVVAWGSDRQHSSADHESIRLLQARLRSALERVRL